MKIKKGVSILHNNSTNCTYIADELDEKVQTGTRENDSHIEWMGDLTIPVEQPHNPLPEVDSDGFKKELETLINRYSKENGSNTPDFLLAEYLTDCLGIYDKTVMARSKWYGGRDRIDWVPGEDL